MKPPRTLPACPPGPIPFLSAPVPWKTDSVALVILYILAYVCKTSLLIPTLEGRVAQCRRKSLTVSWSSTPKLLSTVSVLHLLNTYVS